LVDAGLRVSDGGSVWFAARVATLLALGLRQYLVYTCYQVNAFKRSVWLDTLALLAAGVCHGRNRIMAKRLHEITRKLRFSQSISQDAYYSRIQWQTSRIGSLVQRNMRPISPAFLPAAPVGGFIVAACPA
jgi:hypothetical protein